MSSDIEAVRDWMKSDDAKTADYRVAQYGDLVLRALDALEREESEADDHADYEASAVVRIQATLAKVVAEREVLQACIDNENRLAAQVARVREAVASIRCSSFIKVQETLDAVDRALDGEVK